MSEVVDTTAGAVRGAPGDGVVAFKGIPYGDDTSGEGRFRAPRPPLRMGRRARLRGVRAVMPAGHGRTDDRPGDAGRDRDLHGGVEPRAPDG